MMAKRLGKIARSVAWPLAALMGLAVNRNFTRPRGGSPHGAADSPFPGGGGVLVHRDGKPLFADRACARLLGYAEPEELIRELDDAEDKAAKSVEIAGRVIKEIKPMCQGVHLMPVGLESRIPEVLQAAEIVLDTGIRNSKNR